MKPAPALLAALLLVASSGAGPAYGQLLNGQQQSVVAVHAQAHDTKGVKCSNFDSSLPCDRFISYWRVGVGADVYFVIANADPVLGVSGVSLGVDYGNTPGVKVDHQGCDVFGYVSCADQEYPNGIDPGDPSTFFPAAGGGNRLLWNAATNCQRHQVAPWEVEATVCAFYVYAYSPDQFIVDMNRNEPTGPEFQITDCASAAVSDMDWQSHAGIVGFGGGGYNPCGFQFPWIVGAAGAGGSNVVHLEFSAPIGYGWTFTVYPSADPASPLGVTGATGTETAVTLTLASNLAGGTSYGVTASYQTGEPLFPVWTTGATFVTGAVPTARTTWGSLKARYR